jgi:hypothetical protein
LSNLFIIEEIGAHYLLLRDIHFSKTKKARIEIFHQVITTNAGRFLHKAAIMADGFTETQPNAHFRDKSRKALEILLKAID